MVIEMWVSLLERIFSPILSLHFTLGISIFALLFFLLSVVINRLLIDQEKMKKVKEEMEKIKRELKSVKLEDKEKFNKLMKRSMEINTEYMMMSMKSLVVFSILFLTFLPLLQHAYSNSFVTLPFTIPLIGSKLNWISWYIIVSLTISFTLGKILR